MTRCELIFSRGREERGACKSYIPRQTLVLTMSDSHSLKDYRRKRDLDETPEPRAKEKNSGDNLHFVIHKHDANTLHYDFRLEVQGVLKSWAVPKGPSTDPDEKKLSVPYR